MYYCVPATRIDMVSPVKSEMEFDDSEDEQTLPSNADPSSTVPAPLDLYFHPTVSALTDLSTGHPSDIVRRRSISPSKAARQSSDEPQIKSQLPVLSTTPLRTPPKTISFPYRAASEPGTAKPPFGQTFEGNGFSNLRNVMSADSPPSATQLTAIETNRQGTEEQEDQTFAQQVQAYQDELNKEFEAFERALEGREKSAELDELDWDELEQRYVQEINSLLSQEDMIRRDLGERLQVSKGLAIWINSDILSAILALDAGIW
jgi:hypothetical protein